MNAFLDAEFWIGVGVLAGIYGIFTLGLQLNLGFTGVYNFGQIGFAAIGAYAAGVLVVHSGLSFWLAVPVAIVIATAAGVLMGLAALRLRVDYFAIATLAFAQIVQVVILNARGLTGGGQGILGFDRQWDDVSRWMSDRFVTLGLPDSSSLPLLVVAWVIFAVLLIALLLLQHTPWGRVLRSIREDEVLAQALGKNAFGYKLQSLAISAAIGAVAGVLLSLDLRFLVPEEFTSTVTFTAFTLMLVGGWASYPGVAVGAILLMSLLEATRFVDVGLSDDKLAALRFVIVGLALILLARFRPQGLMGKRGGLTFGD
jgi:branched-chain amino acid transport system permease protein